MKRALLLAGLIASLCAASAAGGTGRVSTMRADVAEWSIVPSTGSVPAGRVRILVRNLGFEAHQVVLVRTSSFDERLPLRRNRAVVHPIVTTTLIHSGGRASLDVTLRPGSYLLLDNLPWSYWKGASVAFTVS
jgi:hypothetical protein